MLLGVSPSTPCCRYFHYRRRDHHLLRPRCGQNVDVWRFPGQAQGRVVGNKCFVVHAWPIRLEAARLETSPASVEGMSPGTLQGPHLLGAKQTGLVVLGDFDCHIRKMGYCCDRAVVG